MSEKHTLSVLVENKPGVLTRVSALFTRRGFNIHSLAVGPTEHEAVSRIIPSCWSPSRFRPISWS